MMISDGFHRLLNIITEHVPNIYTSDAHDVAQVSSPEGNTWINFYFYTIHSIGIRWEYPYYNKVTGEVEAARSVQNICSPSEVNFIMRFIQHKDSEHIWSLSDMMQFFDEIAISSSLSDIFKIEDYYIIRTRTRPTDVLIDSIATMKYIILAPKAQVIYDGAHWCKFKWTKELENYLEVMVE